MTLFAVLVISAQMTLHLAISFVKTFIQQGKVTPNSFMLLAT